MTAERETFDPEAAARISAALVKAIAEAKAMADAENFGPDLHDIVRHARELHDPLSEQVDAADPGAIDRLRAACNAMGDNVRRLEELVEPGASRAQSLNAARDGCRAVGCVRP